MDMTKPWDYLIEGDVDHRALERRAKGDDGDAKVRLYHAYIKIGKDRKARSLVMQASAASMLFVKKQLNSHRNLIVSKNSLVAVEAPWLYPLQSHANLSIDFLNLDPGTSDTDAGSLSLLTDLRHGLIRVSFIPNYSLEDFPIKQVTDAISKVIGNKFKIDPRMSPTVVWKLTGVDSDLFRNQ